MAGTCHVCRALKTERPPYTISAFSPPHLGESHNQISLNLLVTRHSKICKCARLYGQRRISVIRCWMERVLLQFAREVTLQMYLVCPQNCFQPIFTSKSNFNLKSLHYVDLLITIYKYHQKSSS